MTRYTNAQIVAELRRVFKANGEQPFSRREYQDLGEISKTTIENRFGTWSAALDKARLLNRFERAKTVSKKVVRKRKVSRRS